MDHQIQRVFAEIADLSNEERRRYYSAHAVPEEIRREVDSLVRFDSGDRLLEDVVDAAAANIEISDKSVGDLVGPYSLVRLFGRGGMGAVYLAERTDGEVDLKVAIKFVHGSGRNGFSRHFLKERRILANAIHPGIARLFDVGRTLAGEPYLVMEFVDGTPIDTFAATLSIRQKITLFLNVCAAVAYLHRNLVVHRDLKPSNILVTAEGEPKLLDFGIAKILDLATNSMTTSTHMLTPDYASPEQVTGKEINTATDIYSMGAVLYRLLTGKPVHEFEDPSAAAFVQVVTTREPVAPGKWSPELKGDLESILLKALRKNPQERYLTVEQFAEDLQAYLESRSVRARSGNAWYTMRKFVRRYWVPVTVAALIVASLSIGLYVANRQRLIAENRFAQLHDLSNKLLELDVDDLHLRTKLTSLSIQYLEGLEKRDLVDNRLALEIGSAYLNAARILGVPEWNQQGQYAEAEKSLNKVDQFADSVLRTDPDNRQALWLRANAAHDHAVIAYALRQPDRVLANSPKVVDGFNRLAQLGSLTRGEINGAT
jgi:serine/threonine protein kinase